MRILIRKIGFLVFLFCCMNISFSQILKPKVLPTKKLSELSVREIQLLFNEVNPQFKIIALNKMADGMANTLNGSLLIALNDSVVVRRTYGYAKLYDQRTGYESWTYPEMVQAKRKKENLLDSNSCFELASLSKQFTAAAVLKLASENKLNLNDLLSKYYPQIPYYNIKIHQLLSHTSGLPEYIDLPLHCFDTSHWLTNAEMLDTLIKSGVKRPFDAGEKFQYTNTNYAILALIVEKVSGMKFEEYMHTQIFLPAGMTHTFYITELQNQTNRVIPKGHARSREELPYEYSDGTIGDKGIYSTSEDLMKWKTAYFNQYKIIPKEWLKEAVSVQNKLVNGKTPSELYGYGLRLEENPYYGKLIYHGGLWHGFQNMMVYRPSDNLLFISLSNLRNGAHLGKSNVILNIVDGV
ncbi:MAG: serine hydrolase domain-containing protein [Bacteroidales bacterium]